MALRIYSLYNHNLSEKQKNKVLDELINFSEKNIPEKKLKEVIKKLAKKHENIRKTRG